MSSTDAEIAELKARLAAARAERRKEKKRAYRERPDVKEKMRAYRERPDVKEKMRLRAIARAEAKETGQPVEAILVRMTSKTLAA